MLKFDQNFAQPPEPLKIVLTGGGTAGHVLPHIALLPYIRPVFYKIYYIGSHAGIEKSIIANEPDIEYRAVTTVKLRRSLDLRNLMIPFKILKGVRESVKILREIRPNIVFSKGGFVAYPVVRAAAKLGIPVVAHESDMTMGLANRLSARHCKVICTTFAEAASARPAPKALKYIHTGSPIRDSIFTGDAKTVTRRHGSPRVGKGPIPPNKNLLVMGGSLGAAKINAAVRDALPELLEKYNVIHICGRGKTVDGGRPADPAYIQLEYVNDIENYFAWADIVVSRAGSGALCELLALTKPTVFIPLSKAQSRGDQIENASELLRTQTASVLFEEDLTPETLASAINKAYENREAYARNAKALGDLSGTKRIAGIIAAVSTGKGLHADNSKPKVKT
jgi:UDP-N-acetylglucosamine--N-acetylmuramyl-(pentapeptide) pyrophosphoryl-undecaprenol N-acetylglucosamine transferase